MRQVWQTSKTRRSSRSRSPSSQNFGSRMSNIDEVPGQRLRHARRERRAVGVAGMFADEAHARAAGQGLALHAVEAEADELHGADALGVELPAVEVGHGDAAAVEV